MSTNGASLPSNLNSPDAEVLVVGGGPVGLLMALKLGLGGVKTVVIEKHDKILAAPRAIAYLPTVNRELEKMGLLDEILKYAHCSELGPCWRKLDTTILARLGHEDGVVQNNSQCDTSYVKSNLDRMTLMIGQDLLSQIVLDHLEARCQGVVEVRFGAACIGIQQLAQEGKVVEILTSRTVKAGAPPEEALLTSKWVVGADGANSFVRKASCIPFEGTTWTDFRFTASDIEYKFDHEGGYRPITYITDPEEWAIIAKAGIGDVWRIAYGERTHLPEDEALLLERSKHRIPRYLPGSKEYKLRRLKPYTALQRCATTFRKGRVVLVGDAAHVSNYGSVRTVTDKAQSNNPVGGLGLTSGILDAVAIGNSLVRHLRKGAGEELIDMAANTRRIVWVDQVNPATQVNFKRLFSQDPEVERERETFFRKVNNDLAFPAQLGREIDELFKENFED